MFLIHNNLLIRNNYKQLKCLFAFQKDFLNNRFNKQINMFGVFVNLVLAFRKERKNNVVMITRNGCGFSQAMRDLCFEKKLKCVDLNEDVLDADIKAITTKKVFTYPSVFVNGVHIGGYTEANEYFNNFEEIEELNDKFKL